MLIHCFSGSPFTWRALMVLSHKGIEHEARYMPRMSGEHRSDEMLAANPRGRLPILQDGDLCMYESLAICRWLESEYPEPSLRPSTREGRALCETRMDEVAYFMPSFDDLGLYLFTTPPDQREEQVLDAKLGAFHAELKRWEGYLAGPDAHGRGGAAFLAGDAFSLADVAFYPLVAFAVRIGLNLEARYPAMARYVERVSALECVEASSPPHWKESEGSDMGFGDYDRRHPAAG